VGSCGASTVPVPLSDGLVVSSGAGVLLSAGGVVVSAGGVVVSLLGDVG